MIALIQNITQATSSGNSTRAWQALFSHLGIKGNENAKGDKPITAEKSTEIFDAVENVLKNEKEDKVINELLDGIHNLLPYMNSTGVHERYNQLYDAYFMQNA